MKVKLEHPDAKVPVRGSEHAAGLDLYACEDVTIPPGGSALVNTGVCVEIMSGYLGLIRPRSKISSRFKIGLLADTVDSDYRGEVKVSLINHHKTNIFEIKKGDKIAQMLVIPHYSGGVTLVDELSDTERGSKGIDCEDLRM